MADLLMNLDLNQQPTATQSPPSPPSPSPFESFSVEHEPPRRPIEDRIRFAISVSARQPQSALIIDPVDGVNGERLRNNKTDVTQLAKALEMDLDDNKTGDDNNDGGDHKGAIFDCKLCLNMAKDPILTCCGHLFCWGCFCNVPYVDSVSKECPVCNGEVIDSNIIPVYGNGNGKDLQGLELDSRMMIPPRPKARRVESVGQQSLVDNNNNNIINSNNNPVEEAIRSLRINLRNSNSVVHASVNIQPQYVGSVEIDVAVSNSRRRRRRRLR